MAQKTVAKGCELRMILITKKKCKKPPFAKGLLFTSTYAALQQTNSVIDEARQSRCYSCSQFIAVGKELKRIVRILPAARASVVNHMEKRADAVKDLKPTIVKSCSCQ